MKEGENMKKPSTISNIVVAVLFVLIIVGYGILNIKPLVKTARSTFDDTTIGVQQKLRKIEQGMTESLPYRHLFIDFYGGVQKGLNKSLIGNFEFMKSSNGFMHMAVSDPDIRSFVDSIPTLKMVTDQLSIPLIYVQVPPRSICNTEKLGMNIANGEDVAIANAKEAITAQGISYLDLEQKMVEADYSPEKLFFKTDLHLTTEGEFFVAQEIVNVLKKQNIPLEQMDIDRVLDVKNYDIDSRPFLGNLSRSSGKYYSPLDVFDNYMPKFATDFSMTNHVSGERRTGSFEDVFMNNYKSSANITERTYWVTNYLQYTQSYYEFINHNKERNKLLVICDSMGMRTVPLLSLLANKVTVVDIRFQGERNYILDALKADKYDAVIILHENSLFKYRLIADIVENPNAEILSHNAPTTINRTDSHTINITVKNTSNDSWSEEKQVRLCIWQDGKDYGYRLKLPEGVEIAPGEEYTFQLNGFVAPPGESTYIEFQMLQEGITYFGEKERVDIKVIS
jgi:hypothetical protein